ncbi:hypothetical protein [Actinophytocola sp.]|uniref:hypothetical protein n=1 Tax=Actinophytocola sp. TaxID=1872138 RepID=UPI003D6B27CA
MSVQLCFALPSEFRPIPVRGELRDRGAVEAGWLPLAEHPEAAAMLVLAVREVPAPRSGMRTAEVVEGMAEALRREQPHAAVESRELAGGPAVVLRRAGTFRFPEHPAPVDTVDIQVLIPTPDLDEVVVLDVSTGHVGHWPEFAAVALAVAETVRFTRPEISGRLDLA